MIQTLIIPPRFLEVTYDSAKYPGSGECNGIENGANCQYFAYEFLRHFGLSVPGLRSSELWEDSVYTREVHSFEPLDLIFFNKNEDPYGAHIGVYLGDNEVFHLSKEVGRPAIWDMHEFKKRPQYSYVLGGKRVVGVDGVE